MPKKLKRTMKHPYTDIPQLSPTPPRCVDCGRALYGNVVNSPICPWCDVARQDAEIAELYRRMDTPPAPTPTDGSDITPITGSPEGDALMYGEDDSPEVGDLFDDLAGWEDE